ncbi:CLN3 protein [Cordyceps javanica]|uniref:Protein BTN n=1 Tax=Cordyceps javanica TaxID=43265 RepID=A0A545V0C4_9HYPO|nr:CLN3 protein [Cordyceps javanica]
MKVVVAFWLLGLINNVLYVIILSAAQDLVGTVPKGVVLLADVVPSFFAKLIAPYFIHHVPYRTRVLIFCALSVAGMSLVALTPPEASVAVKMVGVVLASLSSGGGELSFLGLTHFYGPASLAGWGSGTGAAGLVGAGLYVAMTEWWRFSVRGSLLFAATLPVVMLASFFAVLPQGPLLKGATGNAGYGAVPGDDAADDEEESSATAALLNPRHAQLTANRASELSALKANLRRARSLVIPYMLPLLLVYVAEYTINQGVAPTLLFPLSESPFAEFREFYPFYGFLYQLGVFISRSSISFVRIHRLYLPSFLQIGNLALLTLHAMLFFIPSVYFVFIIIFWEGLLGGAVYVNCFAEIMENVPEEEREFSLSATTLRTGASVISCALLSLPSETLIAIFQLLDPIDAVCLALASKHLLHVSAMVTIMVPSVAKHRNVLPSTCKLIYELLWRFTPKVDRKVWRDAKKKFGLCCDCLRHRPKKKAHWTIFAQKYKRTRGVKADSWRHAVAQWNRRNTAQCPECYCQERDYDKFGDRRAEEHPGIQPEKASEGYADGIDAGSEGARHVQER